LIDQQDLELAAWSEDERFGQAGYCGQLALLEVFIWHDADGMLHWEATDPQYLAQEMLESLDTLLRDHGFAGTRRDDPEQHQVVYEQADGRVLDLRLLQHGKTSWQELHTLAEVFLAPEVDLDVNPKIQREESVQLCGSISLLSFSLMILWKLSTSQRKVFLSSKNGVCLPTELYRFLPRNQIIYSVGDPGLGMHLPQQTCAQ
jgi:hypothetical protein